MLMMVARSEAAGADSGGRAEVVLLKAQLSEALADAAAARREAASVQAEATRRSEAQGALVKRIEAQLAEQMQRSAAATKALMAAEEIQRRLDAAAAGVGGTTIVLLPE